MTHDELHSLLVPYAAATLSTPDAEAVRAHLASGCPICLAELYRLPVGTAPAGAPDREPGASVGGPRAGTRAWRSAIAAATVLIVGLTLATGWTLLRLGRQDATHREELARITARVEALDAARTELAARASAAEREREATAAAAVRQREEAEAAAAARLAELERERAAAEAHAATLADGIRRRDAAIDRLLGSVEEARVLHELLATPGVELLRLAPVTPFREPRGHVLWHPARDTLILYAFDLPPLPAGTTYRVRVEHDAGSPAVDALIRPGPRGDVALPLRVPGGAGSLRQVAIVRGSQGAPILAGRVTPTAE